MKIVNLLFLQNRDKVNKPTESLLLLYRKFLRISYIIKFYAQLRARNKSCAVGVFGRESGRSTLLYGYFFMEWIMVISAEVCAAESPDKSRTRAFSIPSR